MLIGGMFDVDIDARLNGDIEFPLRFDRQGKYHRTVYTNNGRTATTYAFRYGMKIECGDEVLMPEYSCISCFNALEAENLSFSVYKINPGLIIDTKDLESKITEKTKVIYVIHYFGVPQPIETVREIQRIAKKYNLYILEDLTQTVLTRSPAGRIGFGDYIVMSTRKWYPMADGGLVAARDDMPFTIVSLPDGYDEAVYRQMLVAYDRKKFKNSADISMKKIEAYLTLEKEANAARYLDFTPKAMSEQSAAVLASSDHEKIAEIRRENYQYLYQHLQGMEGLKIWGHELDQEDDIVPFGFMVIVEHRAEFYQYLAARGIIGEIQWILPTQYYKPSSYSAYLGDHSLMLQCDQRFGVSEMERTVQVIKQYFWDRGNKEPGI